MPSNFQVAWFAAVTIVILLFTAFALVTLMPRTDDVVCPPLIEASTKLRLYFDAPPPELTNADRAFAELCGIGDWTDPVREAPPEGGA